MREIPILFSSPMVRALLAGTKTQTRRVVALPRKRQGFVMLNTGAGWWPYQSDDGESELCNDGMEHPYSCPYGQPGDRLWVREAFSGPWCMEAQDGIAAAPPSTWCPSSRIWYWADGNPVCGDWTRPRPSIHMPRWASRILLEVIAVRVERLQDISEADAIAEGTYSYAAQLAEDPAISAADIEALIGKYGEGKVRCLYAALWESINGADSWAANPWVWVVEFKRVTP
ncbi:MAG: hypothetical protein KKD25_00545 [Gammaproteobacteria bacterium]|nr:hypothetical protein [Gammaproteobacteria bacterium]MBU0773569.1 hypothetical protein [Gammaproteobacteria bacterium]MBU0857151.1 hypothetical protein [Gammaproteobacteria bacterium]MBU1848083.1 hypothetical protein [Gammaproteobacteria bacterium]